MDPVASRRRPRPARRRASRAPANAAPPTAETLLLDLARDLTARAGRLTDATQIHGLAEAVAGAFAPEKALAKALREDWLRGRGDKTARLALGWAREQVRLALVETLHRARAARLVRTDVDAETLAWLWLAAAEALAHEAATAVADRASALAAFLTATER